MARPLSVLLVLMGSLVARGVTYSTGAPPEGCWSDRPLHGDNLPQGGHILPYKLVVSSKTYGPKDTLVVSLVATDQVTPLPHKGFLLRMISSASQRGGQWAMDPRVHRYNPQCGITHRDGRVKTNTTVMWRAPPQEKGHLGRIQLRAVVAANFTHFWDNIVSDTLIPRYPEKGDTGMLRRFQRVFSILTQPEPDTPKPGTGTGTGTGSSDSPPKTGDGNSTQT